MNTPIFHTKRLTVHPPSGEDINAMVHFFADVRSQFYGGPKYLGTIWHDFSVRAGQWLLLGYGMFAIVLHKTNETIGLAEPVHPANFPEPEISWLLTKSKFEGEGFARETCEAVLTYLIRNLGWTSTASYIDYTNHTYWHFPKAVTA